jgi:hypothetical protein
MTQEILKALYCNDKNLLSDDLVYSEEGAKMIESLAVEMGINPRGNIFTLIDRIFDIYRFYTLIKKRKFYC